MGACHQDAMAKYSQVDGRAFNPRKCCQFFFFLPLEFSDEKENVSAALIGWIVLYHMFPVLIKLMIIVFVSIIQKFQLFSVGHKRELATNNQCSGVLS